MGGENLTQEQVEKNAMDLIESKGQGVSDADAEAAGAASLTETVVDGASTSDAEVETVDDAMARSTIAGEDPEPEAPTEPDTTTETEEPTATDTEQKPEWDKDRQRLQQELANKDKEIARLKADAPVPESETEADPSGLTPEEAEAIAEEFPDDVLEMATTELGEEFTDEQLRDHVNAQAKLNKNRADAVNKARSKRAAASALDTAVAIVGEEHRNDLLTAIEAERTARGLTTDEPLPADQLKDMYAAVAYRVKSEAQAAVTEEKPASKTPQPGSERTAVAAGATEEQSDTKHHGIELDLGKL